MSCIHIKQQMSGVNEKLACTFHIRLDRLTLFWMGGGKFALPLAGFFNIAQKPLGLGS